MANEPILTGVPDRKPDMGPSLMIRRSRKNKLDGFPASPHSTEGLPCTLRSLVGATIVRDRIPHLSSALRHALWDTPLPASDHTSPKRKKPRRAGGISPLRLFRSDRVEDGATRQRHPT
jgi:hypothetical protein